MAKDFELSGAKAKERRRYEVENGDVLKHCYPVDAPILSKDLFGVVHCLYNHERTIGSKRYPIPWDLLGKRVKVVKFECDYGHKVRVRCGRKVGVLFYKELSFKNLDTGVCICTECLWLRTLLQRKFEGSERLLLSGLEDELKEP
jgi:hypothetical protein